MMRRPLTTLMLVALFGSLALLTAWTATGGLAPSAGARSSGARLPALRSWQLTMSPAPGELSLAEIEFNRAGRRRISPRSLQVAVRGPFGDDYLAAGATQLGGAAAPRALVLLVNRPSPLEDPVSVHLRVTALGSLGAPVVRTLADPFSRAAGARTPALCDLPEHGSALSASELLPLHTRGQPLAGFDAASALAQAYDVVCGLPSLSSFAQAVEQPGAPSSPAPAPPVGKLPGEGCVPTHGTACPG